MDTEILTEKQAAKRAFMVPDTLRKWRTRGRGPAFLKLGGKVRYRAEDVDAWILACRVEPGAKRRRKA